MKLPLNWLKEYVDIGDITADELSDKLLSIGFEVEEIIRPRTDVKGVVVGKVLEIERHQNSDKLWICRIDIGTAVEQIVTGAQNVKKGDIVPVATVGAVLPVGKTIAPAALRGVESRGMLCSGGELLFTTDVVEGADVDGILILPSDFTVGDDIMHAVGLDDTVLDVSITANRPDCQAIVNLAREIAVLLGKKFTFPKLYDKTPVEDGKIPPVEIKCKDLCSNYIGRLIKDITIERSPLWMRNRLRACGIRPINNIVDITNYVLLEMGQPLHAFDRSFIDGGIIVRKGRPDEKIVALDGKEYGVADVLIIADHVKPLAIAGIMGGEYTSILPETKDVFLEAARFERSNIRRTSRRIGLRSDSSSRYEKGLDWQSVSLGSTRALQLFVELGCGTVCDSVSYDSATPPENNVIETTKEQICALLGIDIDKKTIVSILKKQGFEVAVSGKKLICTVPLRREDVDAYPDLAEDIMRFYGYDNIVSTYSENTHQTRGELNVHDRNSQRVKDLMCAAGADEMINYSFVGPDAVDKLLIPENDALRAQIPLLNPLSRDISVMRTQLVSGILMSIARNVSRKNDRLRCYELGKIFVPESLPLRELPEERDVLCIGLCNDGDFYSVKSIAAEVVSLFGEPIYTESSAPYLHPGQSVHVECNGVFGEIGKLHPAVCENFDLPTEVYVAHLDLTEAFKTEIATAQYRPISKLQPVDRDLALVVEKNVPVGDMLEKIKCVSPFIYFVKLFDIYVGEQIEQGYKSVAFSLRLQPVDSSFTDADIRKITDDCICCAEKSFGAKLR